MNTIIKIAWRNVWRNKLRSSVVICSISLGLWGGLFVMSLILELNEQRMNGAIKGYLSHLQIHHPKFQQHQNIKYTLAEAKKARQILTKDDRIKAFTERVICTGVAASSSGLQGIQLLDIDPEKEKKLVPFTKT